MRIIVLIFILLISSVAQNTRSNRLDYNANKEKIDQFKEQVNSLIMHNNSGTINDQLLSSVSDSLFSILTEKIFPLWYGTKWGFNGITRVPGEGEIACGSFVVFTLQDVGFNIPKTMHKQPLEKIENWIRSIGEGLYIVGLDIHTGFIIYKNDKLTFCHSSYYNPPLSVVNQEFYHKSPLTDSNYRVVGKILTSEMVYR